MSDDTADVPPASGPAGAHVDDAPATWDLASLDMEELHAEAAKRGVPRRWEMSRRELILTLAGDRDAYDALTVEQLRHLAEKRGLSGRWDMNKSQLISALVKDA